MICDVACLTPIKSFRSLRTSLLLGRITTDIRAVVNPTSTPNASTGRNNLRKGIPQARKAVI